MQIEEFVSIADMDEWSDFWAANHELLESDVGKESLCMELAMNCGLLIGGGAATLFRVGFVD